jgi:hypothetical protein
MFGFLKSLFESDSRPKEPNREETFYDAVNEIKKMHDNQRKKFPLKVKSYDHPYDHRENGCC